jgi:hypothetical protein
LLLKGKGIIGSLQRGILRALSHVPDVQHFYLTGGTALAEFYLGHRKSFDLDLFTSEKNLVLPFGRLVEDTLKREYALTVVRRFETFAEFEVRLADESTRLQVAYDSPARFEDPIESDTGIRINDYRDIITDKLLAFFGRAEPRDAVDLFFILQREDFWKLTELAAQKEPGFDLYWLAAALHKTAEFPDEVERWPVEMVLPLDALQLKSTFKDLSNRLMEKIKKPPS